MKNTPVKVGMIVEHPKRPQWGPGKVIAVSEDRVYVFFRDDMETRAKSIIPSIVELKIAESQNDAVLDQLPPAKLDNGDWILTKAKRVSKAKAAAAAATAQ